MNSFVQLFNQIDGTTKTNEKVNAIVKYFNEASDDDKLWTLALFSGRNPKRIVKTSQLKLWAAELANIPLWLFEETYQIVGDLSETIASLLPDYPSKNKLSLTNWMLALQNQLPKTDEEKKEFIVSAWLSFSKNERFVFNKLTSGNFRMGVSQKLIIKALSKQENIPENVIAHRLMGEWKPTTTSYANLLFNENKQD